MGDLNLFDEEGDCTEGFTEKERLYDGDDDDDDGDDDDGGGGGEVA